MVLLPRADGYQSRQLVFDRVDKTEFYRLLVEVFGLSLVGGILSLPARHRKFQEASFWVEIE